MQLSNRLSQLFQKETDRLLKSFLNDNPDILKKYVDGGVIAVGALLGPINLFMRHLLVVQGLDPETVPGEKQRLLVLESLTNFFDSKHEKDFDDDYDLSWVNQKFEKTRGALKDLNMTKDRFMQLTDLSRLPNVRSSTAPVVERLEDLTEEPIDHIAQRVNPVAPEAEKRETRIFDPGDAIQQLRSFMNDLGKKLEEAKSETSEKHSLKPVKKKLNKGKRVGSGPRVQRVANTEPVKEGPSTLVVESDRKERPPSTRQPGRNLRDIASQRKAEAKIAKESTPEFQAQLKARIARATELTNLMVQRGLVLADDKSRQDQIESMKNWTDNNFDALERVVTKYGPTKDAVAENKFKGSFRRVKK